MNHDIKFSYLPVSIDGKQYTQIAALVVAMGEVVGTVRIQAREGRKFSASISQLFVRPEWRSRGIGKALVEHCCTIARNASMESISLFVNKNNFGAQEFYRKLGFVVAYEDPDDFIMTKLLWTGVIAPAGA